MATEPSRLEANRLYWETDASVAVIAEQLGLSRRALYELLEVAPAEPACPVCGGPLTFANRLARSTGDAYCAACAVSRAVAAVVRVRPPRAAEPGAESAGEESAAPAGVTDAAGNGAAPAAPRRSAYRAAVSPVAPPPRLRAADFAVAAAVGLAAGFLAALLFSRRSAEG